MRERRMLQVQQAGQGQPQHGVQAAYVCMCVHV